MRLAAWKKYLKEGNCRRGRNKVWDRITSFLTVRIWEEIQKTTGDFLRERFPIQTTTSYIFSFLLLVA